MGRLMDSYRDHPSEFDLTSVEASAGDDVAAAIGTDERRMHVRAYNHWVSLLHGRDFPSIEDLEAGNVQDFSPNSVLLDFTCGIDNPALPFIGPAIRDECGLTDHTRDIADVPSRSLLSRLTDHYMQIIANRAPVGFEAEFDNQRGESICYRGILMPFSSDGDTIDFIYGVINWKRGVVVEVSASPVAAVPAAIAATDEPAAPELPPLDLDEQLQVANAATWEPEAASGMQVPFADPEPVEREAEAPLHFSWEDGPLAEADDVKAIDLDANPGLADRLWAARETAEAVKAGEGRTRSALYKALSLAYEFAVAAHGNPADLAELLDESGVKAQARAPMTPIVKLVFGIDYDKARLTEFAAALCFAQRQQVAPGGFQELIEQQPGGLKGLVAAERQARRPAEKSDTRCDAARARLRSVPPMALADLRSNEEFAVVVTRRAADGRHEAVALVVDEALVARAIRKAA